MGGLFASGGSTLLSSSNVIELLKGCCHFQLLYHRVSPLVLFACSGGGVCAGALKGFNQPGAAGTFLGSFGRLSTAWCAASMAWCVPDFISSLYGTSLRYGSYWSLVEVPRNTIQNRTNPVRDATICRRRGRKEQGFQYFGMLARRGTMAD
jgi:hypothetical protein